MSVNGVDGILYSIVKLLRENGFRCENDFEHNDFYYAKIECEWKMVSPFSKLVQEFDDKYGRTMYMRFDIPFEFRLVIAPLDRHERRTVEKQLRILYDVLKSVIQVIKKYIEEG